MKLSRRVTAIILALVAVATASAAQQIWQVKGGDTSMFLLEDLIRDLGIKVSDLKPTATPSAGMENAFAFQIAGKSDLLVEAEGYKVQKFVSGEVSHTGGFAFTVGGRRFPVQNFSIRPRGGTADEGFAISGRSALTFDLRNAIVQLNPYTKELIIGYMDVLISREAARAMGRADLAGQLVGCATIVARLELVGGEIPPPTPQVSDPGGGPDNAYIDVKLHALSSLTSLGRNGVAYPNGVNGLSVSTTSCNVGTMNIEWYAPMDVRHPVIAMNLYRVKDGKFEQVGASWLKHGFLSTNSNGCGTCQNPGSGALLGINCSDTYGTGNNGDRYYLGERKEVNPFLGTWECRGSWFANYVDDCVRRNTGSGLDGAAHRLEVRDQDLGNAGATYYYEAYYITRADVDKYNNIGYRRVQSMNWTGTQWSFTTASDPLVNQPAITVWGDMRSTATPRTEGDVIVAVATTDLGGGNYRYEYAVYVHDLDRQIREFVIPVGGNATVSNITFRDIDWNAGNEWTGTYANGKVIWSTQTYQQNPNANSLKYSSVYNFGFTANVAPISTARGLLGQFKPGNLGPLAFDTKAPPAGIIWPTSFAVTTGLDPIGGLDALYADDAIALTVQNGPSLSTLGPGVEVQFIGTAQLSGITTVSLTMDLSTTAVPPGSIRQDIQMYDYQAGAWVTVDSRSATGSGTSITVTPPNGARFVNSANKEMRARVQWFPVGPTTGNAWRGVTDEVVWATQ